MSAPRCLPGELAALQPGRAASVQAQLVGQQQLLSCASQPFLSSSMHMQVASLEVQGPRYWAHRHDAAGLQQAQAPPHGAQEAAALYVRRKTGAMPYEADPKGVRSLLLRAAHMVSESRLCQMQCCCTVTVVRLNAEALLHQADSRQRQARRAATQMLPVYDRGKCLT